MPIVMRRSRQQTRYLRSLRCDDPAFLELRLPELELECDRLLLFAVAFGFDFTGGRELALEGCRPDVCCLVFVRTACPSLLALPVALWLPEGLAATSTPPDDESDAIGPVRERLCLASER